MSLGRALVLTISDSASLGKREDLSGPEAKRILQETGFEVSAVEVLPDERAQIESRLRGATNEDYRLVVTSGGTGLSPRDVTPEATLAVIDRHVPGIAELMRLESFKVTPRAALSRAVAGTNGSRVAINQPSDAIAAGIGFVTEDRKRYGLLIDQTIVTNLTLAALKRLSGPLVTHVDAETAAGERSMKELHIKARSVFTVVGTLSGGNQQKVVLAKWLLTNPKVLFLDEPTRGIDVGAKQEIYQQITRLASEGLAIVLVSSELPEVLGLSDRIVVLHEGHLTGEFNREQATAEGVMACATGQVPSPGASRHPLPALRGEGSQSREPSPRERGEGARRADEGNQ